MSSTLAKFDIQRVHFPFFVSAAQLPKQESTRPLLPMTPCSSFGPGIRRVSNVEYTSEYAGSHVVVKSARHEMVGHAVLDLIYGNATDLRTGAGFHLA